MFFVVCAGTRALFCCLGGGRVVSFSMLERGVGSSLTCWPGLALEGPTTKKGQTAKTTKRGSIYRFMAEL